MSGKRSRAREVALQLLFQHDQNKKGVPRRDLLRFAQERLGDGELEAFALELYDGVCQQEADIDARLAAAAEHWRLHRMPAVDRNVLRLGAFELLHHPATPPITALDEAIELARRFGGAESPAFVNGVLDRIHKENKKDQGP
jgi:N utilization substance protein B